MKTSFEIRKKLKELSVKTSLGFHHSEGFSSETSGLDKETFLIWPCWIYIMLLFLIVVLLPHKCTKKKIQYPTYYAKILEIVEINK